MFNILKTNLKHFFIACTVLFMMFASFGTYHGAEAHLDNDILVKAHFILEDQGIDFKIRTSIEIPPSYDDSHPILAIPYIEIGYKAFRDFLIANGVIDESLRWTFGKGHLVLQGDLIDRGNSVTQVLRFIYKMM